VTSEQAVRTVLPPGRDNGARPALLIGVLVVALLPLLTTPLFPFIDLYNHLARHYVLGHLAESTALQANYSANWGLLPNIGLDIIGTAAMRVVPPAISAHLVGALLIAVQYGGVLAFNRALTGRSSLLVALLVVPLLYSFILNWVLRDNLGESRIASPGLLPVIGLLPHCKCSRQRSRASDEEGKYGDADGAGGSGGRALPIG
jgi:hypothetical protein